MTLLTAGALTDHQLPATSSNMCTSDARLGGVTSVGRVPPPQTKILATLVVRLTKDRVRKHVLTFLLLLLF